MRHISPIGTILASISGEENDEFSSCNDESFRL